MKFPVPKVIVQVPTQAMVPVAEFVRAPVVAVNWPAFRLIVPLLVRLPVVLTILPLVNVIVPSLVEFPALHVIRPVVPVISPAFDQNEEIVS
jgi:hypothetical protein